MKRFRAPKENYAVLAEPPFSEVGTLLAGNRRLFQQPLQFLGRPWSELRQAAAQSALAAANSYMQAAGEPLPAHRDGPLLLAGHQPELFHPGVWIKNFALCRLARAHRCVPLNLIVDSDTAKSTKIHLPEGDHLATVPFDHTQADVPFEERTIEDEALFASLAERTKPLTQSWPFMPMLPDFWPEVLRQGQRTPLLGERFVAARRTWERRWQCHNFEVPLSKLCQTEPFAWFACHLLADLPRFHAIYNEAVQAYRREHGIRSRFHPVPDLAPSPMIQGDDWLEAPFWIWLRGKTRRERLFAKSTVHELQLRCGSDMVASLPRPDRDPAQAVARWLELEGRGIKIRTRALLTTMFARLLVGDAFLHGIGGGKYDELTDVLIQQFHGVQPPQYLVLSATLLLPLPHFPVAPSDVRRFAWEKRDSWWNPQRHSKGDVMKELAKLKQSWIERPCNSAEEKKARFLQLREITAQMRQLWEHDDNLRSETLTRMKEQLAVNQVLSRRDYAFCLYPEEELRKFMTDATG